MYVLIIIEKGSYIFKGDEELKRGKGNKKCWLYYNFKKMLKG